MFFNWDFCSGVLCFVGADGKSDELSNEMARSMVDAVVMTCVNGLNLTGLSCVLLGLLCPLGLVAVLCLYLVTFSFINELYV